MSLLLNTDLQNKNYIIEVQNILY